MANAGGSYIKKKGQRPKLVECTVNHKDGNRPRDENGKALGQQESVSPKTSKPASGSASGNKNA